MNTIMVDSQWPLPEETEADREETPETACPKEKICSEDTPIPDSGDKIRRLIQATDEEPDDMNGEWIMHHGNVPVYCEYKEHIFRRLLRDYEGYMLNYESAARRPKWKEHYKRIQETIDSLLGLDSAKNTTQLTKEEIKTLKSLGHFALFGCGFNVTRELSPRLKKALRETKIQIVLVDFSKKALKSSIDFLAEEGITPAAAYQMDLTMGAASVLNTFRNELRSFKYNDSLGSIEEYKSYLEDISRKLDTMIKQFESEKKFRDMFDDYQMREDHRPTAVVSTMVTTATFLTIFDELVKQFAPYPELHEDLERLHAKYNAFIVRLNAAKLTNLCKGNGKVCMIMDVNKICIDVDPTIKRGDEREIIIEEIRDSLDAVLESGDQNVALSKEGASTREELRISRDGANTEPLEQLLNDVGVAGQQTSKKIEDVHILGRWHWWDENDFGQEHGHRVEAVAFSVNNMKTEIRELLDQLPDYIKEEGDPEKAAMEFKALLNAAVSRENQNHNSSYGRIIDFLNEVEVPEISCEDLPEEMLERRRPYVFKAGYELINLAHSKIWESKWEKVLEYLIKERKWSDDGYTQEHVKTGLDWLRKFLSALKS